MVIKTIDQGEQITRHDIRQNNLNRVYNLIRSSGELSSQEIAAALELSLPTVAKNLSALEKKSLVQPCDVRKNTGGRNSRLYKLNADEHVAVGVNITRHHISAVVINLRGEIISQVRFRELFTRSDAYSKKIANTVTDLIREARIADSQVLGVSLVLPALITDDGQATYYNAVLEEDNMMCSEFSKYLPYPARFCHDGKAASYAESWFYPESTDFFYLMISDSIIGTPILSGRPYNGLNHRSGEIGHVRLIQNGQRCYCGKRGCMEVYCSTKVLSQQTDGNLAAYFDLLRDGDAEAVSIWNEYLGNLAIAINDVRLLFDCSIIIGGYLGAYIDPYLDQLYELATQADPFCDSIDYISVCKYKTEASATGGALLYIDEFIHSIL